MSDPIPPGSAASPPVPQYVIGPLLVPPTGVAERGGVMSVLSNVSRNGEWVLPRLLRALTVMGDTKLDLTQIRLAPGASEIDVRCFMGNVKIVVPHNLRVECVGTPFLGEFTLKHVSRATPSPDAPLIRITGSAFMGSVVVKVIDPNSPRGLDKLREWIG
jgi:Cell wall-active antibiotics response 4TMS YvqF